MTEEFYILAIVALLPVTAALLVFQTNPYQALVIRGILGALAALVYALLGAADVALTEALVGTMLSITLYAVAVRSSMSFRLGVLEPIDLGSTGTDPYRTLLTQIRKSLSPHHMRVERISYPTVLALQTALIDKEIHGFCQVIGVAGAETLPLDPPHPPSMDPLDQPRFQLKTRVHRLFTLMQTDLSEAGVELTYINPNEIDRREPAGPMIVIPESVEVQG